MSKEIILSEEEYKDLERKHTEEIMGMGPEFYRRRELGDYEEEPTQQSSYGKRYTNRDANRIAQQKIADKESAKISPITLRDMTKDLDTFRKFDKEGAFESDLSVAEMLWNGSKAMVVDSYDWINTMPERVMSNFGIQTFPNTGIPLLIPPSGMTKKQKAQYDKNKKRIQAKGQATTLQTLGNIDLNYELMGEGLSLLKDKMINKMTGKSGSVEEDAERYRFWKSLADIEERRQTVYAELATNDFLMMGGDPEIREMIKNGEVQPDYGSAMGGSMWADPLNYVPLTAGFRVAKGGTSFRGMERAVMNDARDAMILKAGMEQLDKVKPSPELTRSMKAVDGFITENLDKLDKLAKNRPVALEDFANKLPQGHPLRDKIKQALNGVNTTGKVSKTGWAVGGAGVVAGKSVEGLGSLFEFASRLPVETGINLLMKMGLSEEVAVSLLKNNKLTRLAGMVGGSGLFYGAMNLLTDDEMVASLLTAGFVLPQLAKTYGRDIATMSRELMSPETTLPYWKRMSMRGAEDISSRTIDRSTWSPIKSLAEDVVGASSGKVKERLFNASGQLQSMKKGGLYGIANALDKSKAGRYLETGGRMAKGGLAGGTMGGIFGYVAGGGEQDEAGWGGVGAGFTLGAMGALAGNYGRFRGARSSAEIIQMRHGDWQYFTQKLLPESQKETFNKMPKEHQIAYASASMSRPATEFRFLNLGKDDVGGKQYIEADGTAVVEVNVDSEWSLQPLLHHEITHYIEEVGGRAAFDNMLIGNPLMETSGMFTKLDKDGKPIKKFDENGNLDGYEVSDAFNELKFKYFIKFGRYKELYDKSVKMSLAHGTSNKNAHEFAYRRVIQKIDQMEVMRDKDGVKIADADTKTAREIVAEHGVDFLLNDPRRYRDLHEGWVGAFLRNVVDSPLLNNAGTLRGMLAKLGATFRENGLLASDNNLFGSMQRIAPITNLLRKYNRQMEGLSKDQMDKKFPLEESESTIADVQMTGQDFARHPELIENLRAGTFLQVDSNGNIIPNAPMSPKEIKAYNTRFTEAIKEATEQLENEEGLPEGHIRSQTTKTNETRFEGRYISDKVLDMVAKKGGWNKAQIDTLRSINSALRDYANEKGGTDWLFSYFKASKKGKYVSAKVQNKIDIPYGIEITKDGNINIRVIDLKLFNRNIERAFKNYQPEIKRLYGNDLVQAESLFRNDLHKYHMNHAEGKQGMTGLDQNPQIAEGKAKFINALFGKSSKAHAEANPWLAQISGNKRKAPSPTYRSRRIERIGKVQQLSGKQHVDINKILTAFMPEKRVDMDALLKQDSQRELNTRSGVNQIPAFHGSKYDFDKFSTNKIGTGEGAQAFGYGLYFAGSKDVAKFYRDKLSRDPNPRYKYTPEVKQKYEPLIEAEKAKREEIQNKIQVLQNKKYDITYEGGVITQEILDIKTKATRAGDESLYKEKLENLSKRRKEVQKKFDTLDIEVQPLYKRRDKVEDKIADLIDEMQSKGTLIENKGKLYEVDLKPKEEEFLIHDKKLNEQSKFVQERAKKILRSEKGWVEGLDMDKLFDTNTGQDFYNTRSMNNEGTRMQRDATTSKMLLENGIRGIKFLDGKSRHKGEGDYNYIIFDDADVEITAKYMPKFEGASDNVPKIIEDINIATDIFGRVNAFNHAWDRSWHINTLVKRVLMNAENDFLKKRIQNAEKRKDAFSIERGKSKLENADKYFYYMKYPLQDLVASLPDIKSRDVKRGLNSERNADPFEPIRDNFQGGQKRPLQDILQEMANVHQKIFPEDTNTLNEIRGIGEILKDDYGADIKPEFLDELYRRYRNLSKEEHEQFKIEEQKTLKELFNPEFNDIKDIGLGTKLIKPIDPDANLMPKAPDTPEFRNFFKDSKVVDDDGKPLVVYHGTDEMFNTFDPNLSGTGSGLSTPAFWFTDAINTARDFGEDVMQTYLSIKNPLIKDFEGGSTSAEKLSLLTYDAIDNGHDGLILKNFKDGSYTQTSFAVFKPTQIKSVDNRGTFDPSNPDIRFMPAKDGKEIYQMSSDEFKKRGFMRETDDALTADYYETMKEIRGEPPITEILNLVDPVANHRTIVEQALKDGKDVTYDAVAEYPELTIRWMAREQREGREIKFLPSAERKPVTFSARPEEIVTLDSENIKNFMPAHDKVRLEDYLDYPIFCLPADRMGVGTMFVGPEGQKIPVDVKGQGGRGFMYLYEDGGWAFSKINQAKSFLTRVRNIAKGRDHALVGITIMSDINHLNSVFGQLSLAQAYEAVLRSGHVSKEQMRDYLQDIMGRVAEQKYGQDKWNKPKTKIIGKKGEYKLPDDIRKALQSIDSPDAYKQVILDRKINFDLSPQIVEKTTQVNAKISPADQKKFNIDVESVAKDTVEPELYGQPNGQVVALLKVPVDQTPSEVNFHLSYPWQIKGEPIGFLDQFKALKDLAGDKRIYKPDGSIAFGQRIQSVLPAFDKLNPALYMPNYKPMLDAKLDNISGLVMPKIKQDKFSPQQFKAKLSEVKGAKEMAEDLGLLDYLEGKKSVTKDEIDQYISDNRKSIMLRMENGHDKYEGTQMEGGKYFGYNEILFVLPESSRYPFPDVSGGHYNDRTLMHMRVTKRMLDDGSDGEEGYPASFHIEEMQSDWHQTGRGEGYADSAKIREVYETELGLKKLREDRKNVLNKTYSKLQPEVKAVLEKHRNLINESGTAIELASGGTYTTNVMFNMAKSKDYRDFLDLEMMLNGMWTKLGKNKLLEQQTKFDDVIDDFEIVREDVARKVINEAKEVDVKISQLESITDKVEQQIESGEFGQSPAPFKNSWQHRAFADAVQMAVNQGHSYLTWTTGKRSAEMAKLDNAFNSVEVRYTKEGYLKPDGSNKYAINAEGKEHYTIRKSLSEQELIEIIGKDYAQEAITRLEKSDKPITANKVELTDIVVPHKGRRLLYDSILPSVAKRIAKTLGTRPPTKAKIILRENAIVPERGKKAGHETQEVWVMELPKTKEKLHELQLYMPSMMPLQNIPAMPRSMKEGQTMYFAKPQVRIAPSKASQARELEPENSYFKN